MAHYFQVVINFYKRLRFVLELSSQLYRKKISNDLFSAQK